MFTKKSTKEIEESNRQLAGEVRPQIIVLLEDVRSMHNVGSVFRTCDAFGAEALWLCGYTPTPPHRDIHKSALGATETVRWQHFPTAVTAIENGRRMGYSVLAVEQAHNSISLEAAKGLLSKPSLLVFGNEVTGVSDSVLKIADGCIEIPQTGSKHSLNISVSAGVLLWEAVRLSL